MAQAAKTKTAGKKAKSRKSSASRPKFAAAAREQEAETLEPKGAAPQLMRRAEPLDPVRHGSMHLREGHHFGFVADLNTVPLSAVEFMPTARHYPIIFAGPDDDVQPVALVGLRPGENLFVSRRGRWKEGCYVPAILRRAPFILLKDQKGESKGVKLCLDVESPLVSSEEGTPLFEDNKPTAVVAKMANFAAAYSKEQSRTRGFVDACLHHDLLVERRMDITLASGQKIAFAGFRVIDEQRLRALEDGDAVQWFRRGWNALAVAHFLSLGNMGRLHHRANRRAMADARAAEMASSSDA